ncbi:hypothetical protein EYF80_055651 [Liparis tanakae]|uniref:Uncharacterized protein n=1 Tax=Liparis tanakae TaxID=230148 RepID=A0A4Z2EYZ1_9TELE|nr:hypothetical protein EYF80_055651 [Liparis tanakae]
MNWALGWRKRRSLWRLTREDAHVDVIAPPSQLVAPTADDAAQIYLESLRSRLIPDIQDRVQFGRHTSPFYLQGRLGVGPRGEGACIQLKAQLKAGGVEGRRKRKKPKQTQSQRFWVLPDQPGAASRGPAPIGSEPEDKQMLSALRLGPPTTHSSAGRRSSRALASCAQKEAQTDALILEPGVAPELQLQDLKDTMLLLMNAGKVQGEQIASEASP